MFAIRGGTACFQQQKQINNRMQKSKQNQTTRTTQSFKGNTASTQPPLDNKNEESLNGRMLKLLAMLFVIQGKENEALEKENSFMQQKLNAIKNIVTGKKEDSPIDTNNNDKADSFNLLA